MRTKTPSGWIELDTDPLDWIDSVLAKCIEGRTCLRHLKRYMMRPVTKKARDWGNRILGISLLNEDFKLEGTRNWLLPNNWRGRLERAGVHPDTLEIFSPPLWETTLMRLDTEDYRKKMRAVEGREKVDGMCLEPLHAERLSNGEQSPAVDYAIRQRTESRGLSFGQNTVTPSAFEIVTHREPPPSGPPHRRRNSNWYR